MTEPRKPMLFRCPPALKAAIVAAAKGADLSVNEWTIRAIRSELENRLIEREPQFVISGDDWRRSYRCQS